MKSYFLTFLMLSSLATLSQSIPSTMKSYAFRLVPHEDVKKSIMSFAKENGIKAGCILSAVGSLEQLNLRYANREEGTKLKNHFEVVSLTGTFSETSSHLHLSASDSKGFTLGGHLLDDNLVFTTLEIVVGELEGVTFDREIDLTYGYSELVVKVRPKE